MLEQKYLVEFYGSVAVPALLMAERDRLRGVLTEQQLQIVTESTKTLVANLEQIATEEEGDDEEIAIENPDGDGSKTDLELPSGEGRSLLTFGGRRGSMTRRRSCWRRCLPCRAPRQRRSRMMRSLPPD